MTHTTALNLVQTCRHWMLKCLELECSNYALLERIDVLEDRIANIRAAIIEAEDNGEELCYPIALLKDD